jgi:hypothetical protein
LAVEFSVVEKTFTSSYSWVGWNCSEIDWQKKNCLRSNHMHQTRELS